MVSMKKIQIHQSTESLVVGVLTKIGCLCKIENQLVRFWFQGGTYFIYIDDESEYIKIWITWHISMVINDDIIKTLYKEVDNLNVRYSVKCSYIIDEKQNGLSIYFKKHMYVIYDSVDFESHFRDLLDEFSIAQRELLKLFSNAIHKIKVKYIH